MTEFNLYMRKLSLIGLGIGIALSIYIGYFYAMISLWTIPVVLYLSYSWGPFFVVVFLTLISHVVDLVIKLLRKRRNG